MVLEHINIIPIESEWSFDFDDPNGIYLISDGTYIAAFDCDIDLVFFCNQNVTHYEDRVYFSDSGTMYLLHAICEVE
jgi:hypothetical protein